MTPRAGSSLADDAVPSLFDLEPGLADLLDGPQPEPLRPSADLESRPDPARTPPWSGLGDLPVPPPPACCGIPVGGLPELSCPQSRLAEEVSPPVSTKPSPACPPVALAVGALPPRAIAVRVAPPCPPLDWPALSTAEPADIAPASSPQISAPPRSALLGTALQPVLATPRGRRMAAGGALAAAVIGAILTLVVGQSGGAGIDRPRAAISSVVDSTTARIATARLPLVDVYASPGGTRVVETLVHPVPTGGSLTLLVESESTGWLRVRLPTAPAGRTGWIRADAVDVSEHAVRLHVDLDRHLLTVLEAGRGVTRLPIALGRHDRPEPGTTFVADRIRPADAGSGYGAEALLLAGYGNGLEHVFRGSGLVAVHAVADPSAPGQTVSRGSIGLHPDDLDRVAAMVVPGTPVEVVGGS